MVRLADLGELVLDLVPLMTNCSGRIFSNSILNAGMSHWPSPNV